MLCGTGNAWMGVQNLTLRAPIEDVVVNQHALRPCRDFDCYRRAINAYSHTRCRTLKISLLETGPQRLLMDKWSFWSRTEECCAKRYCDESGLTIATYADSVRTTNRNRLLPRICDLITRDDYLLTDPCNIGVYNCMCVCRHNYRRNIRCAFNANEVRTLFC